MVAPSPLEFRRRSPAERRALEMLRGERASIRLDSLGRSPEHAGEERRKRLRELAHVAMTHGFAIQPPRAAYVHLDELRLLHLIADAQAGKIAGGTAEALAKAVDEAATTLASCGIDLFTPSQ